jgi:hypothetical protein
VNPRAGAALLLVITLVGACGPSAARTSPTPPAAATPSPAPVAATASPTPSARSTAPSPAASPSVAPSSTPSASVVPSPTPTVAPTAPPSPPTAAAFWDAAAQAIRSSGRLRVRVIGPAPGELLYELNASATAIDGEVVFVCRDGQAFDGQSGWIEVPGSWTCGADALVAGFRTTGQPLDAWSPELPPDEDIEETLTVAADGTWRWDYSARNPFAGGRVRTIVILDAATGQIRSASRLDPTGETTYGISYSTSFPAIRVP